MLVAVNDGRASVAVGVTDDATGSHNAVELVRAAVAALGGQGGGGRADMALCSTVKWPLAAVVLDAVDAGGLSLDQRIRFDKSDLLSNSPRTRENLARGSMSVAELLEAAITVSDNAAANLLLPLVGGPEGVTRQFRAWGDAVTRLDRREPMLNRVGEGEVRDTTTPAAMAALLRTLLRRSPARTALAASRKHGSGSEQAWTRSSATKPVTSQCMTFGGRWQLASSVSAYLW